MIRDSAARWLGSWAKYVDINECRGTSMLVGLRATKELARAARRSAAQMLSANTGGTHMMTRERESPYRVPC